MQIFYRSLISVPAVTAFLNVNWGVVFLLTVAVKRSSAIPAANHLTPILITEQLLFIPPSFVLLRRPLCRPLQVRSHIIVHHVYSPNHSHTRHHLSRYCFP